MTPPRCAHGQTFTGVCKNRCPERAEPGSMLCGLHKVAALVRVRESRDERTAVLSSLRWTGMTAPAWRVWA